MAKSSAEILEGKNWIKNYRKYCDNHLIESLRILIIILLFCITHVSAQEVKGILYDSEGRVADFEIVNQNTGVQSATGVEGFFAIQAEVGDSLVFNSIQYEKQLLIVEPRHLQETIVVELKKSINALDQVNISSSSGEFNAERENTALKKEFVSDRERNWFLYEIPNSKGNLYDGLVSIFNKLFPKEPEIRIIELRDFQELFASGETLNYEYLKARLQIPENRYNLFFDYLESKSLNYDLLDESKRLDLIQQINDLAEEYLMMLEMDE
ncbi:hypothetical protein MKO06_02975 [Gramella sp. GC03-9]|uniref:Carboxypeptidase-like protein n=1 Tax=Christiangramia oceanisediminis TaxID=2920386 RepID=A0A9X2KVW0_9FLAO|nr:hypothetical protein [Gramella oceanisediminis]MCP9198853.1 hypothetical protein [Gramella oceanisediminis]